MMNKIVIDLSFLFFSTYGRISRKLWWISNIALWLSSTLTFWVYDSFGMHDALFGVILTVIMLWMRLMVNVKRWHDRNKSAWWILLEFIPVVGFVWTTIELGFLPSKELKGWDAELSTKSGKIDVKDN